MRRAAWILLGVALVGGCKRTPKVLVDPLTLDEADEAAIQRERIEGPGRWDDPVGRLCMNVPVGWSGWRGWKRGGPIVTLEHLTGAKLAVYEDPPPAERKGFTRGYEDPEGQWRDVPVIQPSSTVTWISEVGGPTIIEWYGGPADRMLRVELTLPWGRKVQGRLAADALLAGLCRP